MSESKINKPFRSFYILSILIVLAVMVTAFVTGSIALVGDFTTFVYEEELHASIYSITLWSLTNEPMGLLILVFAAAPTIAALIISHRMGGWQSVVSLLKKLKPFTEKSDRQLATKVYIVLFLTYFVVSGIYIWVGFAYGSETSWERVNAILGGGIFIGIFTLFYSLFLDEGGTLEELGWRGFAWPILQEQFQKPLVAAIFLGFMWWLWHIPRDIPTILTTPQLGEFIYHQAIFLTLCIFETIVCVYFVNLVGGSVLPAIMIHGGSNVWAKALGGPMWEVTGGLDIRTLIMVVVGIVILVIDGKKLGRR